MVSISGDNGVLIATDIRGDRLVADILWLNNYATATIFFPDIGEVTIPEDLRGQRTSYIVTNITLKYAPISTN